MCMYIIVDVRQHTQKLNIPNAENGHNVSQFKLYRFLMNQVQTLNVILYMVNALTQNILWQDAEPELQLHNWMP